MSEYTERQAQIKLAARKRRRKRRRDDLLVKLLAGLMIVGGFLAFSIIFAFLATVPVLLGWDLGVVGISRAVHGHIHPISFWTALGASLCIGVLSRIFQGSISFARGKR